MNYRFELYARPKQTVAGDIRTYELANTHGEDRLLGIIAENALPGDVIYDVGAYVGSYALALGADHPDRTVVAFEPHPEHCQRFHANRRRTDPAGTIRLETVGLGDADTDREFYHASFPKLSSFDRAEATRWGATVTDRRTVPVRSLDSFLGELPPPDHLKIDVEGNAPAVLRGGEATIRKYEPLLYIEPHDRPGYDRTGLVREWCDNHGYSVATVAGNLVCYPEGMDREELQLPGAPLKHSEGRELRQQRN